MPRRGRRSTPRWPNARSADQHDDDRTWDQLQADVVVDLLTGARAAGDERVPEVSVLIDYQTLIDGFHDGSTCETSEGLPLPLNRCDGCCVRRTCCRSCSAETARCSTSAGSGDWRTGPNGGRCGRCTAPAPTLTVRCRSTPAGSTTSSTGNAGGVPTWPTCFRCVSATTTWFTKEAGCWTCSPTGERRGERLTTPCTTTGSQRIACRHQRSHQGDDGTGAELRRHTAAWTRPQASLPSSSKPWPRCPAGRRPSDAVRRTGVRGSPR